MLPVKCFSGPLRSTRLTCLLWPALGLVAANKGLVKAKTKGDRGGRSVGRNTRHTLAISRARRARPPRNEFPHLAIPSPSSCKGSKRRRENLIVSPVACPSGSSELEWRMTWRVFDGVGNSSAHWVGDVTDGTVGSSAAAKKPVRKVHRSDQTRSIAFAHSASTMQLNPHGWFSFHSRTLASQGSFEGDDPIVAARIPASPVPRRRNEKLAARFRIGKRLSPPAASPNSVRIRRAHAVWKPPCRAPTPENSVLRILS
jgi:hypothetical protein